MAEHEIKETDGDGEPICGRKLAYRDEWCDNEPGYRTDHEGEGACFRCGGDVGDAGAPEGNTNGMKYGQRMPPSGYFDALDDNHKQYVIDMYRSYMSDAPFGYENFGKASEVWLAAIDRHKRLRINNLISDEGMMVAEDKVAPDGSLYSVDKENPLNLAYHRLERDTQSKLQKLGVLEDGQQKMEDGEMSVSVSIQGVEDGDV